MATGGGVAGAANDPKRKLFGVGYKTGEPISKASAVKAAKAAKPKKTRYGK